MLKTLSYSSAPLFYTVVGSGLPVVLLHGFAEDSTVWDNQVAALSKNYQLIIPDLPGSGHSLFSTYLPGNGQSPLSPDLPTGEQSSSLNLEVLAELIKIILDAEAIDQAVLIGHSMGGYITLAFAQKYPERLKAFGLFHSTAYADTDEKVTGRQKCIEFIRKNGSEPYIRQSMPNLFAEGTREQQPELITGLIDHYSSFNPEALAAYQQAMIGRPDRTQVLQQSRVPVLFIFGEQDSLLPLETSLRQTHMPALSTIHLLENSGHMGMLEDSVRSNQFLDDFLRSLSIQ